MKKVLDITDITIFPVNNSEGALKARVCVVLNDQLQLTQIRIYEGENGLFISFPLEHHVPSSEERQVFYPVANAFREYMEEFILLEYSRFIKGTK